MRGQSLAIFVLLGLGACARASAPVRFPLRDPLTVDTDTRPVSVPCRPDPSPKDRGRIACAPRVYVSPYVWEAVDNTFFAPVSRFLRVAVGGEAVNANSLDEVADSAWFENRIGEPTAHMTPAELASGACLADDFLPAEVADGAWIIDHGKDDGSTPGFRVNVPGHGEYLLKADEPSQPERASAASVIGAALYHAAGFHTSCEQVVYIRRSQLSLTPGLTVIDNFGMARPFDEKRLTEVLASSSHRGDLVRMQASKWLPGLVLGPFRYHGTRGDDPNDVIAHENRRELRGSRLLAAWMNHWDAREQNSLDTWMAVDGERPWSSPGYVRHQIIDTSDVLGQRTNPPALAMREGHSYYFDFRDVLVDFFTAGAIQRPWDRASLVPGHERFGYFSAKDFDPETWKSGYPNPAFARMTERDAAWMARIIARFTADDVRAIVAAGQLSDPTDVDYVTSILLERQRRILQRYLTRLSPLADVQRQDDGTICAVDLARQRGVLAPDRFRYDAVELTGGVQRALSVTVEPDGRVCFSPVASSGPRREAAPREVRFQIHNGTSAGPLDIYTYDLGAERGVRIVGLRRPGR